MRPLSRWAGLPALVVSLVALSALAAAPTSYTARVVGITDGDTLHVLLDQRDVVIRLQGIDAPERGQAFGEQAKQALAELAYGEMVTIRDHGTDQAGRRLGEVILRDGRSVNRELVRLGFAWWFRKYSNDVTLGALETDARAARRGLWADPSPVAPWGWREGQRPGQVPAGSVPPASKTPIMPGTGAADRLIEERCQREASNYAGRVSCERRQRAAALELQEPIYEVEPKHADVIRATCAQDWPDDFVRRIACQKRQIKAAKPRSP